jgi:hypothetical protein
VAVGLSPAANGARARATSVPIEWAMMTAGHVQRVQDGDDVLGVSVFVTAAAERSAGQQADAPTLSLRPCRLDRSYRWHEILQRFVQLPPSVSQ